MKGNINIKDEEYKKIIEDVIKIIDKFKKEENKDEYNRKNNDI